MLVENVLILGKWLLIFKRLLISTKKKFLQAPRIFFYLWFKIALLPIILLRLDDWLGKKEHCFEGSVGKMSVKLEKGRNFSGCCCTFDNFNWWKRTTMKKAHSVDLLFSFVLWGKSCLEYHPLGGDCNTGQWETHLQMRNKEVCFAYQLLTTSRVAFGCCCLWFCRCMPSNGSRVMDPFPRKLHWNILTVTFA